MDFAHHLAHLSFKADDKHTGFCMGTYEIEECMDCFAEVDCLALFEKEDEMNEDS